MKRCTQVLFLVLATVSGTVALGTPAQGQDKSPPANPNPQLLETVGSLVGGQLYLAYLNIGMIADGKAEGIYEEKSSRQILGSVVSLLNTLDKELDRTAKLDLAREDKGSLEQMRKLSGLLRQQAEELQAFWKTGDKDHAAKYEKARKEAWDGISKLLKL